MTRWRKVVRSDWTFLCPRPSCTTCARPYMTASWSVYFCLALFQFLDKSLSIFFLSFSPPPPRLKFGWILPKKKARYDGVALPCMIHTSGWFTCLLKRWEQLRGNKATVSRLHKSGLRAHSGGCLASRENLIFFGSRLEVLYATFESDENNSFFFFFFLGGWIQFNTTLWKCYAYHDIFKLQRKAFNYFKKTSKREQRT